MIARKTWEDAEDLEDTKDREESEGLGATDAEIGRSKGTAWAGE